MKFFSYGIFIDGHLPTTAKDSAHYRTEGIYPQYSYQRGKYATVAGYKTVGHHVVMAVPDETATLTGIVYEIDNDQLRKLDRIEAGYKRITVRTEQGDDVIIYIKP